MTTYIKDTNYGYHISFKMVDKNGEAETVHSNDIDALEQDRDRTIQLLKEIAQGARSVR